MASFVGYSSLLRSDAVHVMQDTRNFSLVSVVSGFPATNMPQTRFVDDERHIGTSALKLNMDWTKLTDRHLWEEPGWSLFSRMNLNTRDGTNTSLHNKTSEGAH